MREMPQCAGFGTLRVNKGKQGSTAIAWDRPRNQRFGERHMNEKNNNGQDILQIDLWKLLQLYLKKWWVIALFALAAAAVSLFYTSNFITPLYRASVTIYVNNNINNENQEYVSGSDLSTSQKLVSTYTNMLTSDTVLEQVAEATGLDCSASSLRGMISAAQVDETEIFKVYVTNADPVEAATIANAIAQTAPDVIANFVEGSSTKIIDYAKVPTGRFTPSYKHNVMLGFGIGALLAVALLTLQSLLDVRIKEESDLVELFDIPVLGQIPDLSQNASGGSYHAYKKYAKYGNYASGAGNTAEQQEKNEGKEV